MLYLEEKVKELAGKSGVIGVLKMAERCGLSYQRTVKVWKGDESAKISDVRKVLSSMGYDLKIVKCSLSELKK